MKKMTMIMLATSIVLTGGAISEVAKPLTVHAAETLSPEMKREIYRKAFNGISMLEPTITKRNQYNAYVLQIKKAITEKAYNGKPLGNTVAWQVAYYKGERASMMKKIETLAYNGGSLSAPTTEKLAIYADYVKKIKASIYLKVHHGTALGNSIPWQVAYYNELKGEMIREIGRHAAAGTALSFPTPYKEALLVAEQNKIKVNLAALAAKTNARTLLATIKVKWQYDYALALIVAKEQNAPKTDVSTTPAPAPVVVPISSTKTLSFIGNYMDTLPQTSAVFNDFTSHVNNTFQMRDALPLVKKLKAANQLGDVVVIQLGTNGAFYESTILNLVNEIGTDREILFVNTRSFMRHEAAVNKTLLKIDRQYANVHLINWYRYSVDRKDVFYQKTAYGKKLSATGLDAFSAFIDASIVKYK